MSCFTYSENIPDDTFKRIDRKSIVKVILCQVLYAISECVICDANELHNERTNEFPYIFFEYGDYIFVLASAVWLTVHYESGIKTYILKFIIEFWMCVIFTNIALKVVWTQLIEFTSIFCTHLSELLTKLHSHLDYDFVRKAPEMVKSQTCGRITLTAIALLMFFFVLQTVNFIGYNECLIKKPKSVEVERTKRVKVQKRKNLQSSAMFDIDEFDAQFMDPTN